MRRVPTPYKVSFLRRSRNLYDRYVSFVKPWSRALWYEWLGVRPGIRIVDVGCGTGDFTRFLAQGLRGHGHVIGIERRETSLRAAKAETKKGRVGKIIEYRTGDAQNLPLPPNSADLVVCKTLLMHVQDPLRTIREMYRVSKPGKHVAAVETDFRMRCYYNPNGEERNRLSRTFSEAWLKGIALLDGKDYTIGSKLPSLFAEAGLIDIQANLDADPWLNCDSRRPLRDKLSELRASTEGLQNFEETRKYLKAGGMSSKEIMTYRKQAIAHSRKLVKDPEKLLADTTFYGACWFIVTGRKPLRIVPPATIKQAISSSEL